MLVVSRNDNVKIRARADRLLAVESSAARVVELHGTIEEPGGMRSMQRRDEVSVPAGGTVVFEPGGLHLMLIDLRQVPAVGDVLTMSLRFEHAGRVEVEFPARE